MKKPLNRLETKYLVTIDLNHMMDEITSGEYHYVRFDEEIQNYRMKNMIYGIHYFFNPATNEKIIMFPAYGPFCSLEIFTFTVPDHWQTDLYKLSNEYNKFYYKVSYSEFV